MINLRIDESGSGGDDYACVWSGEWVDWSHRARHFYNGPGGTESCTRVMVNCSIENVDTVTDNLNAAVAACRHEK